MSEDYSALAEKALELVPDGSRIGLGSGRTAKAFIEKLGERVRQGLRVRAVPTSRDSEQLARSLGIPVDTLAPAAPLDMTIDGADEIERGTLNAIKGWGASLVRERIVAAASRRQILLVTPEKLVDRLGQRGRLPVEVLPFAEPFCRRQIEQLAIPGGLTATVRGGAQPLVTDNGNWILDCALSPQDNPHILEQALRAIPGVIDTGLFLGTASLVLVVEGGRVREMTG